MAARRAARSGATGTSPVRRDLAALGWQVIVPDRPGHARTPSPGRPDDAEADGALVAPLLGDGAHLVGHSFGACVALAAAALRPGAVRSLTLVEPAMMHMCADDPVVLGFLKQLGASAASAKTPAERLSGFARLVGIPPEIRGGSNEAELTRMGQAMAALKLPPPPVLLAQLAQVKAAGIPFQVIDGGWNPAYGATASRVATLGGGRRVVIASPHHFPQLVSDAFNEELVAFMRAAEGAPG